MNLKKPITLETTFGTYVAVEKLGEGGAGVVYGGKGPEDKPVAIKVLSVERVSTDKRRRFKNEIGFLARTVHPNIVGLVDHGVLMEGASLRPFYVMPRYAANLRVAIGGQRSGDDTMHLVSQLLDGVEAAHLQGAVHRDLKPENVLLDSTSRKLAIADFGVAQFTDDLLITLVETQPNQRLANFQYAAPEQRSRGMEIGIAADIFALGLIMNELFTGTVPQGTQYTQIVQVLPDYGFLDQVVASMIAQNPGHRPQTIALVKGMIQKYKAEAVSLQKLSELDRTVVPIGTVDDPLAFEPPRLTGAEWNNGRLKLTLDRPMSQPWIQALQNMGSFSSALGASPDRFSFSGTTASVGVAENSAQSVIDHFKQWLPRATQVLKHRLEREAEETERVRIQNLRREREAEELRLRVNRSLKI